MNKIRALIIEDEIPAYEELKYMLEQTNRVEVIDNAFDGLSGYKKILKKNFDVAFVDIQIPGINGIELAQKLNENNQSCNIIFITAYDEYAVKAFEINACDYILKPYDIKRINLAIDKIVNNKYKDTTINNIDKFIKYIETDERTKINFDKIPCEQYGRIIFVDENEIIYCYVENEHTFLKTINKKFSTNYTLSELEEKKYFFRVHRSYLININKIKELYPWFHGTYKLVMNDNEKTEIPVSRNNVKKLKDLLGL